MRQFIKYCVCLLHREFIANIKKYVELQSHFFQSDFFTQQNLTSTKETNRSELILFMALFI